MLTSHFHLELKLISSGTTVLLSYMPSYRGQGQHFAFVNMCSRLNIPTRNTYVDITSSRKQFLSFQHSVMSRPAQQTTYWTDINLLLSLLP
jgi:hypothetical protein